MQIQLQIHRAAAVLRARAIGILREVEKGQEKIPPSTGGMKAAPVAGFAGATGRRMWLETRC